MENSYLTCIFKDLIPYITKEDLSKMTNIDRVKRTYRSASFKIQDDGTFISDTNIEVKRGKLLKTFGLGNKSINRILCDIDKDKTGDVYTEMLSPSIVYKSPFNKCKQCMYNKDVSLLDVLGVKCLVLRKGDYIVGRVLIWDNVYYDDIKTVNSATESIFIKYLTRYKPIPSDYRSSRIYGNHKKYFIPYMDTVKYLNQYEEYFIFSAKCDDYCIGGALKTDGNLLYL